MPSLTIDLVDVACLDQGQLFIVPPAMRIPGLGVIPPHGDVKLPPTPSGPWQPKLQAVGNLSDLGGIIEVHLFLSIQYHLPGAPELCLSDVINDHFAAPPSPFQYDVRLNCGIPTTGTAQEPAVFTVKARMEIDTPAGHTTLVSTKSFAVWRQ